MSLFAHVVKVATKKLLFEWRIEILFKIYWSIHRFGFLLTVLERHLNNIDPIVLARRMIK